MSNIPHIPTPSQPTQSQMSSDQSTLSAGNRPVLLLKVKRKAPDQINPAVIQLHRIIEQFEVFPDEISEAEYHRQRKYQANSRGLIGTNGKPNEKKKQDEDLVSLFDGVQLNTMNNNNSDHQGLQPPLFDPTQPHIYQQYQEQQKIYHNQQKKLFEEGEQANNNNNTQQKKFHASGFVSSSSSSTPQPQSTPSQKPPMTLSQIQLEAQKDLLGNNNTNNTNKIDNKSTFGSAEDFQVAPGYDLRSHTVFRKVGVANKQDISSCQLQNWYSTHLEQGSDINNTNTHVNKNIAMFEVETLDSAHQRITSSSSQNHNNRDGHGENRDINDDCKDNDDKTSVLNRLHQLYGDSVQVLLNMKPVEDTNYIPKALQIDSKKNTHQNASPSIPGLKPPPRRHGPTTTAQQKKNSNTTTNTQSIGSFGATSALLDDDTMNYLRQRTLMAQHEQQPQQQQQQPQQSARQNNTLSVLQTNTNMDNIDEEELYDIYEVCVDDYNAFTSGLGGSNDVPKDLSGSMGTPHMVIPRSELDYVIAVNQVDTHFTNSVHEEFLAQFSKPRLNFHQRLLHHISQSDTKHRSGALRRNCNHGDDDHDGDVEGIERGFYDDDHHPDFDSDMDYPDTSDDEGNNGGMRSINRNDHDESYGNKFRHNTTGNFKRNPFRCDNDDEDDENNHNPHDYDCDDGDDDDDAALGFYANPYDDDDDDDDYNNGDLFGDNQQNDDDENEEDGEDQEEDNNDSFRYGGIKYNPNAPRLTGQNPLTAAGLSVDDLDSQDPMTRELVMHAYKMNFRANQRSLDQAGNMSESHKLAGQTQRLEDNYITPQVNSVAMQDSNHHTQKDGSTTMDDQQGPSEKINHEVFDMLFGSSSSDDDDSDGPYERKTRHQRYQYDDEEDPYGGTNTFRQFRQNKAVYDYDDQDNGRD